MLIAAREGHAEVCELLIRHGVDKDLTNKYGYTALHLAAYHGRYNVCKVLIENSVKMDLRTTYLSYMPIHFAAKHVSSPQFFNVFSIISEVKKSKKSITEEGGIFARRGTKFCKTIGKTSCLLERS